LKIFFLPHSPSTFYTGSFNLYSGLASWPEDLATICPDIVVWLPKLQAYAVEISLKDWIYKLNVIISTLKF